MFFELIGRKLFLPPVEYPMRILDCGAGFGNWACAMAEYFESSQVRWLPIAMLMLAACQSHRPADEAHRVATMMKQPAGVSCEGSASKAPVLCSSIGNRPVS